MSDWVFVDAADGGAVYCERCGSRVKVQLPVGLDDYVAMLDGFRKEHAACEERQGKGEA